MSPLHEMIYEIKMIDRFVPRGTSLFFMKHKIKIAIWLFKYGIGEETKPELWLKMTNNRTSWPFYVFPRQQGEVKWRQESFQKFVRPAQWMKGELFLVFQQLHVKIL